MMKIAKDEDINLTSDPKIELYGNAEERMLLDIKIIIHGKEHFLKMKVYNTTCAMDFQAVKHDVDKRFDHLNGLTVGEFFAQSVVEIANILCKKIDIEKLNSYIKQLALEGKNASKTNKKCAKFDCQKDTSKSETLSCIFCKSLIHKSCTNNTFVDSSKHRCETCLINDVKTIQSTELIENESILKLSLLADTSLDISNTYSLTRCGEVFVTSPQLEAHRFLSQNSSLLLNCLK